jgi:hypothetical protein
LFDVFSIPDGPKSGHVLSLLLFNIALEFRVMELKVKPVDIEIE